MIPLDTSKMRSRYVYLLKITSNYVYVASLRNGEVYGSKDMGRKEYEGYMVTMVPISASVSYEFSRYNRTTTFSKPRLAALNFYEDTIVSIEVQRINFFTKTYQAPENWQSLYSRSVKQLEERIEKDNIENIYLNGKDIFYIHPKNTRDFALSVPDETTGKAPFGVEHISYLRLANMGFDIQARKLNLQSEVAASFDQVDNESDEDKEKEDTAQTQEMSLSPKKAMILYYQPNASHPDEPQIRVYGPMSRDAENDEAVFKSFTNVASSNAYASCYFVLRAAKTIAKHYGHHAVDFLEIPKLVMLLGTPCPANIPPEQLRCIPSHLLAQDVTAWLMGYLHRESSLKVMREITSLFQSVMRDGFAQVFASDEIYKDGYQEPEAIDVSSIIDKMKQDSEGSVSSSSKEYAA